MALVHAQGRLRPSARPLTLRVDSARVTPTGPVRKVTYSAMRVEPRRGGLAVVLCRPWAMVTTQAEPTLDDFLEQFEGRRLGDDDRVARHDGKLFWFDEPLSPRRRIALAKMMSAAHDALHAASTSGETWPLPGTAWTGWLTDSEAAS